MLNLIKKGDCLGWEAETALHCLFEDEFPQMRTRRGISCFCRKSVREPFTASVSIHADLNKVLYVSHFYEPGCFTWTIVNMGREENVAKF